MGAQTVFRIDDLSNRAYTKISNELLQDSRVSHETKGLICELLSRPLDWEITVAGIVKSGKSGRDKVYKMIKEAKKFGYIMDGDSSRNGPKNKQEYVVTDDPEMLQIKYNKIAEELRKNKTLTGNPEASKVAENQPLTENPEVKNADKNTLPEKTFTEKTFTANPTQQIKEDNKQKKETNSLSQTDVRDGASEQKKPKKYSYPERFENFWKVYSRCCKNRRAAVGSKCKAYDEWKIMEDWERQEAEQGLKVYVAECDRAEQSLKHCERYLSHKAWEGLEDTSAPEKWFSHPKAGSMSFEYYRDMLAEIKPNGTWPESDLGPPPGGSGCVFPSEYHKQLGIEKYRINNGVEQ